MRQALADPAIGAALAAARRILVFGAGKAGSSMSAAVEAVLDQHVHKVEGWVNVPSGSEMPLRKIHLHAARPAATNQPTAAGVTGAMEILRLAQSAGPEDVGLCLLSGGGSALLPAPATGVALEDKQQITRLLHACGATINEMNTVRKHLSSIKGGRLAQAFAGKQLFTLIISDVIGDPLDVIASGPTAADNSTFQEAWSVLEKYQLLSQTPPSVAEHLRRGVGGHIAETPKTLAGNVHNLIIGNNVKALAAAEAQAKSLGYPLLNLGSYLEGETRHVAVALAGLMRSIRRESIPIAAPVCILSGGETTVTLAQDHGKGGRNQEFVLAALDKLGPDGMRGVTILSGGTDGEDGPTDAAGACTDQMTWHKAAQLGLNPAAFLARNDAYHFFQKTGDLLLTGLTQTNVMDVRVVLVDRIL